VLLDVKRKGGWEHTTRAQIPSRPPPFPPNSKIPEGRREPSSPSRAAAHVLSSADAQVLFQPLISHDATARGRPQTLVSTFTLTASKSPLLRPKRPCAHSRSWRDILALQLPQFLVEADGDPCPQQLRLILRWCDDAECWSCSKPLGSGSDGDWCGTTTCLQRSTRGCAWPH
jgi:hypothetical protein